MKNKVCQCLGKYGLIFSYPTMKETENLVYFKNSIGKLVQIKFKWIVKNVEYVEIYLFKSVMLCNLIYQTSHVMQVPHDDL